MIKSRTKPNQTKPMRIGVLAKRHCLPASGATMRSGVVAKANCLPAKRRLAKRRARRAKAGHAGHT